MPGLKRIVSPEVNHVEGETQQRAKLVSRYLRYDSALRIGALFYIPCFMGMEIYGAATGQNTLATTAGIEDLVLLGLVRHALKGRGASRADVNLYDALHSTMRGH